MKEKILKLVVTKVIEAFLGSLNHQQIKVELDHWIDRIESYVENSENKIDDTVLPVLKFARELFDVPDYPDTE